MTSNCTGMVIELFNPAALMVSVPLWLLAAEVDTVTTQALPAGLTDALNQLQPLQGVAVTVPMLPCP